MLATPSREPPNSSRPGNLTKKEKERIDRKADKVLDD